MITFTASQLIAGIGAICGAITGVAAVVAIITGIIRRAKAPNEMQDERIKKCEIRLDKIDRFLADDLRRFEKIEDGNCIMQRCMLALLRHGIDGNDIESLRQAENDLHAYLIDRQNGGK